MRILFVAPYIPWPAADGGSMRVRALAAGLAARHEVYLAASGLTDNTNATTAAGADGVELRVAGSHPAAALWRSVAPSLIKRQSLASTRYQNPALSQLVDKLLRIHHFDLVQCVLFLTAPQGAVAARRGVPWMLDAHSLEYRLAQQYAALPVKGARGLAYRRHQLREARLRRAEELAAYTSADGVLVVSEEDAGALRSLNPALSPVVIPNGVDIPSGAASDTDRSSGGIFVGKLSYRPNVDAVQWFANAILPVIRRQVPDFTFCIVGSDARPEIRQLGLLPGVTFVGRVDDPRIWVRQAAVSVAPLRAGSGSRLKILEAMAEGVPVVSTSIGCEGLAVVDGEDIAIADGLGKFAEKVLTLLRDPGMANKLGNAGRTVAARYSWSRLVPRLEESYESMLCGIQTSGR